MSEYYSEFGVFNNGSVRITPAFKSNEDRYLLALHLESDEWTSQLQHISSPSSGINIYRGVVEYKQNGYNGFKGLHTLTVDETQSIPHLTLHTQLSADKRAQTQYQYSMNSSLSNAMHPGSNNRDNNGNGWKEEVHHGIASMTLNASHLQSHLNPSSNDENEKSITLYRDDVTRGDYSCMLLRSRPRLPLPRSEKKHAATPTTTTASPATSSAGKGKSRVSPSSSHKSKHKTTQHPLIEEIESNEFSVMPSLTALASMNINDITASPIGRVYGSNPSSGSKNIVGDAFAGLNTRELLEKVQEQEKIERMVQAQYMLSQGNQDHDKKQESDIRDDIDKETIGLPGMTSLRAQQRFAQEEAEGKGEVPRGLQEAAYLAEKHAVTPPRFRHSRYGVHRDDKGMNTTNGGTENDADGDGDETQQDLSLRPHGHGALTDPALPLTEHYSPDVYNASMASRALSVSRSDKEEKSTMRTLNESQGHIQRNLESFSLIHPYAPSSHPIATPGPTFKRSLESFPPPTPITQLSFTHPIRVGNLTREEVVYGTDPTEITNNGFYGFTSVQKNMIDPESSHYYHSRYVPPSACTLYLAR